MSAEIETLQSRSTSLNTRLENRKVVEKLLGPAVEEISISPQVVKRIAESPIDQVWVKALEELEKRSRAVNDKLKQEERVQAVSDLKPILVDLTHLVLSLFTPETFIQLTTQAGHRANSRFLRLPNKGSTVPSYKRTNHSAPSLHNLQRPLCIPV